MSTNTVRFCENCGAALPFTASACLACGQTTPVPVTNPPVQQGTLAPGFLLTGRYRIEAKIGEGGFGMVYKAKDMAERNRLVAIKQITLSALSAQEQIEATDSYNREITLLAKLRHRHLATLYDHFTDAENWYLVLEYIDGQTLEEVLTQAPDGCLPVGEVIHIGLALCDVLGYLHLQEPPIIFRDVKPANIMLGTDGNISLIDFGIARRYRPEQSKDTGPLGSPGYAAPEQYGRAQSSPRTDIYGLGMTLQTLLTGKDPLEIRAHGLPPDCEIPLELQTLIIRMTEPDLEQRLAFMVSVTTALQKLQESYPYAPLAVLQKSLSPFAWLNPLWVLFMQIVGMLLFHASIKSEFFWSFFIIITLFVIGICLAIHSTKNRSINAQQRTLKSVQNIMKGGLTRAAIWVSYSFIYSFSTTLRSIFDHFQIIPLLIAFAYFTIGIVGMFCLNSGRLPFQKAKAAQATPQRQQQAQPLLMFQRLQKRQP